MARPEKVTAVDEIAEKIERTLSLYLTDFSGLDVEAINELRRLLRENSVEYRVVKNTLARRAADKVHREDLKPYLVGPTAIAFGYEDPVLPARLLSQFAQKTGKPQVKAVLFEGQLYQKDVMDRLKFLPSREDLLAKILGGLKSPMTQTVMVFKGMLRNLVGVLDAIANEKGAGVDVGVQKESVEKEAAEKESVEKEAAEKESVEKEAAEKESVEEETTEKETVSKEGAQKETSRKKTAEKPQTPAPDEKKQPKAEKADAGKKQTVKVKGKEQVSKTETPVTGTTDKTGAKVKKTAPQKNENHPQEENSKAENK
jgi:large subunit ribosomal protein L10